MSSRKDGSSPPSSGHELTEHLTDLLHLVGAARQDLDALIQGFLKKVIEWTGAERGIMLLLDSPDNLSIRMALDKTGSTISQVDRFSQSIPMEATRKRKSICSVRSFDAKGETRPTSSMREFNLRSVMAVPLETVQSVIGVLYVDSQAGIRVYDRKDLDLLKSLCSHLALHIENARFLEDRRQQEEARRKSLEDEISKLQKSLAGQNIVIGDSAPMKELLRQVHRIAPTDAGILILGETGTGKESIARLIHNLSYRRDKHLVTIDAATIPENLLESELFGHEKGSFTGALVRKIGKFELAHGGTVFLDEIGDLPSNLQNKLLRVLENKEIVRVGGIQPIHIDIRVIAATNRDLEAMVESGGFRRDLYYRLNIVTLHLPPLRERGQDRLKLAEFFLKLFSREYRKQMTGFSASAVDAIFSHDWPGNVRELKHRIQRSVLLAPESIIQPKDMDFKPMSLNVSESQPELPDRKTSEDLRQTIRQVLEYMLQSRPDQPVWGFFYLPLESWLIRHALKKTEGNLTRAGRILGIERRKISRRNPPDDRMLQPLESVPAIRQVLNLMMLELDCRCATVQETVLNEDLLTTLQKTIVDTAYELCGRQRTRTRQFLGASAYLVSRLLNS